MDNWQPIETAPEGRCIMWVADGGTAGKGASAFGTVYRYSDGEMNAKPDGHHGKWVVSHWMPLPAPPVSPTNRNADVEGEA